MELCSLDISKNKFIIKKVENTPSSRNKPNNKVEELSCSEHDEKIEKLVEKEDNLQQYLIPFNCGWRREIVFRNVVNGVSARDSKTRHADVYYYSPTGKKLRSMPGILSFLTMNGVKQQDKLLASNFTFVGKKISNHANEWFRNAKEKIRYDPSNSAWDMKNIKKRYVEFDISPQITKTSVRGRGRPKKTPEKCKPHKVEAKAVASDASMISSVESVSKSVDIQNTDAVESSLCMICENDGDDRNDSPARKRRSCTKPFRKSPLPNEVKIKRANKPKTKRSSHGEGKLCSFNCPGLEKVCPNLQCKECYCLFHPGCAEMYKSTSEEVDFVCQFCRGSTSTPAADAASTNSTNAKKSADVSSNKLKNLTKRCDQVVATLQKASSPDISKTDTITPVQQQKVILTNKSRVAVESPFMFTQSVNNLVIPIGDCYNTNNITYSAASACFMLPQTPQIAPYGCNNNLGLFPPLAAINTFNGPAVLPSIYLTNNSVPMFPQNVLPNQQLNFQFNLPSPLVHFGPAGSFPTQPSGMQGHFPSADLVYPPMPMLSPAISLSSTQPNYNHSVPYASTVSLNHQVQSKDPSRNFSGINKTSNYMNVSAKKLSESNLGKGNNTDPLPTLLSCISSDGVSSQRTTSFGEYSSSGLVDTNLTLNPRLSSDSSIQRAPLPVFIYDFSTRLESTISSNGVVTKIICPDPILPAKNKTPETVNDNADMPECLDVSSTALSSTTMNTITNTNVAPSAGKGTEEPTGISGDLVDDDDVDLSNNLNNSRCIKMNLIESGDTEIESGLPHSTDNINNEVTDRVDFSLALSPSLLMVIRPKGGGGDENNDSSTIHREEKDENYSNNINLDQERVPDGDDVTADDSAAGGSSNRIGNDKRVNNRGSCVTDNPGVNINGIPTCDDHSASNFLLKEGNENKTPISQHWHVDEFSVSEKEMTVNLEASVNSSPSLSTSPFIVTSLSPPPVESPSPRLRPTSPEGKFRFSNELFTNKEDSVIIRLLEQVKPSVLDFTNVDLTNKQIYSSVINIFASLTNSSCISTLHLKLCPLHLLELMSTHLLNLVQLTLALESSLIESYISVLTRFKHLMTLKIDEESFSDFGQKSSGGVGRMSEVSYPVSSDHRSKTVSDNRPNFSELRALHLNGQGSLNLMESILSCRFGKLTHLNVISCEGWNKEMYALLGHLIQLTSLELCSGGSIPDAGLSSSLLKLENLLELKLLSFVVDWLLSSCIQKMTRLKVLYISPQTEHKGVNEAGYINLCCMFAVWDLSNLSELTWITPASPSSNSSRFLPFLMADASRLKSRSRPVSESAEHKNLEERCLMLSVEDLKFKLQSSLPSTCVNVRIEGCV